MSVLELTPGIAQARTSDLGLWGGRVFDNGWTTSFAIDGAGSNSHEVTLDGVANTTTLGGAGGASRTVAYTPPADMVEEFQVQTASFDASVGYTQGSLIISVKSGSRNLTVCVPRLRRIERQPWFEPVFAAESGFQLQPLVSPHAY
jgi:hypothetical protein